MRPPLLPLITPANVSAPLVIVNTLLPSKVELELLPAKLIIEVPVIVLLMSNIELLIMLAELDTDPVPDIAKAPVDMVVTPA